MRKYLACICVILCIACTDSTDDNDQVTIDNIANFEASIQLLEISLSAVEEVPMKYQEHQLLKIEGEMYLRSRSGNYVTTSLLKKDTNQNFKLVGISCTTSDCSSTDGCIPNSDGKSCTKCKYKCTKTVTGGNQQ